MNIRVLYEDNHLIAVYKPAGMLVQADKSGEPCLMDAVKMYLKETYHKPGQVFLGLLHRLDRPVSGIVLFAKTSKGAARLSEQFREHRIEKIYRALVVGHPHPARQKLVHVLAKNHLDNKVAVVREGVRGAKRAELTFETISTSKNCSLLEITPLTGRPHQIRVQLASIGHPILGDVKYGAPFADFLGRNIALCATSLTFQTATNQQKNKIKSQSTHTPRQ